MLSSPLSVFSYTLKVNVFDLIILAILAALTLRGIWKGMVSQIVSVASYFVCWIVATRFGSLVAPTIPLEAPWDQVAAMAVLFIVTLVAVRFAQTALEKLIKDWHLAKLNKTLGGVLGFAKGLLLCLIITFFAVMLSEASRAVVFNSQSGSHLVQLITRIGLFVPKDSYEFVHTQFDQFQSKVDGAVPGGMPEAVPVQSSKTAQQMLAQLQRTAPSASSLWTAISKLWSGSEKEASNEETLNPTPSAVQTSEQNPLPAVQYSASSLPVQSAETFANIPKTAMPSPAVPVESYFARQTVPSALQPMQPLAALTASSSESTVSSPQPSSLSPLLTLAAQSESLSELSESTQLLPMLPMPHHVGSDLLLHNSGMITNPNTSARVFRTP